MTDPNKGGNAAGAPATGGTDASNKGGVDDPTASSGFTEAANKPGDGPAATNGNGNKSAKASKGVADLFKSRTGLKDSDILAVNDERQTVVTAAGGKYRAEDGQFLVVSGPVIKGTVSPVLETPAAV
jgi:hypothetical protein